MVKLPVPKGVLGVRDLTIFNEAFLGNWLWRFMNEKSNLWRRVVCMKFGEDGLDGHLLNIMVLMDLAFRGSFVKDEKTFCHYLSFEVGVGSTIFFLV